MTTVKNDVKVLAFNKILDNLLVNIIEKFPFCPHVRLFRDQVKLGTRLTPEQPVVTFIEISLPYMEQIHIRDERFFLKLATETSLFADFKIYEKWSSFTEEEKKNIWKVIDQLVQLGKSIILGI